MTEQPKRADRAHRKSSRPLEQTAAGEDQELDFDPLDADGDCCEGESRTPLRKKGDAAGVVFFLFLLLMLTLFFFPRTLRDWKGQVARHVFTTERMELGTVKSTRFIGNLSYATQVDTETQTILLDGAAALAQGAHLEAIKTWATDEVCVQGTDRCWDLRSR